MWGKNVDLAGNDLGLGENVATRAKDSIVFILCYSP